MPTRLLLALTTLVVALLPGCSAREPSPPRPGTAAVFGRLTDAETGAPVSRKALYMHFYCDDLDVRDSLNPVDSHAYEIEMPDAKIRVRVVDPNQYYELFEQTVEVTDGRTELDIALRPTHYVLLRGRFVDGVTGRMPIDLRMSGEWAGLRLSISDGERTVHKGHVVPDRDGAFEVRVPRKRLELHTVNTGTVPEQRVLDLSAFEGDSYSLVIKMIERQD